MCPMNRELVAAQRSSLPEPRRRRDEAVHDFAIKTALMYGRSIRKTDHRSDELVQSHTQAKFDKYTALIQILAP